MSAERRAKYKPVPVLVTTERPVEPSHQLATAILPTNKPSMDHTHALSLSECSSLSSFVAQDQLYSDGVLSSVVEPKEAITVTNTPPIKVVRHGIDDSVQTRSSSGIVRVVQPASIRADEVTGDLEDTVINVDDQSFHSPASFTFDNNDQFDDSAAWRFSTNFVSPPLKQKQRSTVMPPKAQDSRTTVKKKTTTSKTDKPKEQKDNWPTHDAATLSDITSATTIESQSSASLTELADLMQSVTNELGHKSVSGASKQMKQTKKKKGRVVPSRYMAPMKTKTVEHSTSTKPAKTTVPVVGTTRGRSLRGRSPDVRQRPLLDNTLPTPAAFKPSAVVSSTPAVVQEKTASHHVTAVHDGSYITAPNVSAAAKTTNEATTKKATHHISNAEEEKLKREEFKSLRCCALQWAYLDAMTAKAFKRQEEQAKVQMHQLHSNLVKTMDENTTLQNEIATIEHEMAVDATLHSQIQGLGAVAAHLPEVEPQYKRMTQSLDNTRHLMKTDGVIVPSEDELLVTLQRSVELMDNVSSLINAPQVAELAETSKAVEDMRGTLDKAAESNKKLTQELEDLEIEEASLRYHINLLEEIYSNENDN